jgi:hypothetical protein
METLDSLDSMANNETEACLDKNTIIINTISDTYNQVMVGLRADGWFLMSSIWPTIALSTTYYVIVRHAGPKLMESREPYNLKDHVEHLAVLQGVVAVAGPLQLDLSASRLFQ